MNRICKYELCNKDINNEILQIRYCCTSHRSKQYRLNRLGRFIIEEKARIEAGKKIITEGQIPTIITPQASRYQDLLIYSDTKTVITKTVMSKL